MVPALVLACMLAAGAASAAGKDKTVLDMKALQQDNVSPNSRHSSMGALGERVHGGAFGPWRCQIKMLDRRTMRGKMGSEAHGGEASSHFLSLSVMDPAAGKSVGSGKGSVTVNGPGVKNLKIDLIDIGGPFSADVDLPKTGSYDFRIDFASGKQKASTKFSYSVK